MDHLRLPRALVRMWAAGSVAAALLAVPSAAPPATAAADVVNLGLAYHFNYLAVDGRRAAVGVAEAWNGPADLNGDGDQADVILHVHDASTGVTTNLGLPIRAYLGGPVPMLSMRGEVVAFAMSEAAANRDLNQDGDRVDDVAHLVNVRTRVVTNLRDAVDRIHFVGAIVAYTVDEAAAGIDENLDGDQVDAVLALYDLATRRVTRLRLAVPDEWPAYAIAGPGRILFPVTEAAQGGLDRNNDGDAIDLVLAYHRASGGVTNVGLAALPAEDHQHGRSEMTGPLVAINAREIANGADLNGDGDTWDTVGFVVDWVNRRLHRGAAGTSLRTNTTWMTLAYSEFFNGQDRNQDGDFDDAVLEFANTETGATWRTGLALSSMQPNHGVSSGTQAYVVAEVDEAGSSNADLNGDGDAADVLLVRFDPTTQSIQVADKAYSACSFGRSVLVQTERFQPPVSGDRAVACVHEWVDGIDVNKDGDLDDATARVWHLGSGDELAALGLLYSRNAFPRWVGDRIYFEVDEDDNGTDFTGDGTRIQRVIARLDVATGAVAVIPWAVRPLVDGPKWYAGSNEVFVGMWEPTDGRDLNGDGQATDLVLHVLR